MLPQKRRQETLAHLSRIEGQLKALKRYIGEGEECVKVASLSTSIARSFETLRFRTLEGYLLEQFLEGADADRRGRLRSLIQLHKK